MDVESIMSPLKDPLRIENVENLKEDSYEETIKVEHVVETEVKPKSKNCPSCGKYFEKDLSRHIGRVHGEKKWSCEQCDAKFIVKGNLDRHVKEVHIGELVQCDVCPYKSKDKRYVIKHATKAHPLVDVNKMKLDIVIDKEWPYERKALREETFILVNERKKKKKIFLKEEKERKKTLLKLINKKVSLCPHCGKEFSREENLTRHIAFSHEGQVFECNFCVKCYKDKRDLVRHVATYHPFENLDGWMKIKVEQFRQERKINPTKSKKCPHCGKQFHMLQQHIKKVHLLEKIQCDFCPLRYSDKRDVVEHAKRAHPSNDLDKMKFEKVMGDHFNQPKRSKSNPNNNDAIIERYKLLFGHELCNN